MCAHVLNALFVLKSVLFETLYVHTTSELDSIDTLRDACSEKTHQIQNQKCYYVF